MRPRVHVEADAASFDSQGATLRLLLEVMLDVRDLLRENRGQHAVDVPPVAAHDLLARTAVAPGGVHRPRVRGDRKPRL